MYKIVELPPREKRPCKVLQGGDNLVSGLFYLIRCMQCEKPVRVSVPLRQERKIKRDPASHPPPLWDRRLYEL